MFRIALCWLLLLALRSSAQEVQTTVVEVAVERTMAWTDSGCSQPLGEVVLGQVYVCLESQGAMAKVLWSSKGPAHAWLESHTLTVLPERRKYLVADTQAGFGRGWIVAPMGIDELPVGPDSEGRVIVAHAGSTLLVSTKSLALASDYGPRAEPSPLERTPARRPRRVSDGGVDQPRTRARRVADEVGDANVVDPSRSSSPVATTPVGGPAGSLDGGRERYAARSPEAVALFEDAARRAGLPLEWARSAGLHNILERESGGWVGRPNYTYDTASVKRSLPENRATWGAIHEELRRGVKSTRSSASGLGQLIMRNVRAYYPSGVAGIGDPTEEAIGMLRYIKDRYGNPDNAWARYGKAHEGY